MTVQEAKGFIQGKIDCMDRCDVFDCKHTDECESCNYCYSQGNFGEQKNALKFAIECMKELEQYRALGTVEELKEAREKQVAKKPNIVGEFIRLAECSDCHTVIQFKQEYCHKCGNKVDWEEGGTSD